MIYCLCLCMSHVLCSSSSCAFRFPFSCCVARVGSVGTATAGPAWRPVPSESKNRSQNRTARCAPRRALAARRLARRITFIFAGRCVLLFPCPFASRPRARPRPVPRRARASTFSSKVTCLARKHTRQSLRVARASPPCPRRAVQTTRSHIAPRWALRSLGSRLAML